MVLQVYVGLKNSEIYASDEDELATESADSGSGSTGSNILVVYFSCTGTTEQIADVGIQQSCLGMKPFPLSLKLMAFLPPR